MKRFSFLLAMLALGLAFVGCKNEPEVPKSITVTGINRTGLKQDSEIRIVSDTQGAWQDGQVALGRGVIINQTLIVELFESSEGNRITDTPWTGSGRWTIYLKVNASNDNHEIMYHWRGGAKYDIQDAMTELNFGDFTVRWGE